MRERDTHTDFNFYLNNKKKPNSMPKAFLCTGCTCQKSDLILPNRHIDCRGGFSFNLPSDKKKIPSWDIPKNFLSSHRSINVTMHVREIQEN